MPAFVSEELCEGCSACVDVCPTSAITMNDNNKAVVDQDLCSDCGDCVDACPTTAISLQSST